MWENDFAGAKLISVKSVSLYRKIPIMENAKLRSFGVIDCRYTFIYSRMIL